MGKVAAGEGRAEKGKVMTNWAGSHSRNCKFFIALNCPVSIECEHGYDVCPMCDPCTCKDIHEEEAEVEP